MQPNTKPTYLKDQLFRPFLRKSPKTLRTQFLDFQPMCICTPIWHVFLKKKKFKKKIHFFQEMVFCADVAGDDDDLVLPDRFLLRLSVVRHPVLIHLRSLQISTTAKAHSDYHLFPGNTFFSRVCQSYNAPSKFLGRFDTPYSCHLSFCSLL